MTDAKDSIMIDGKSYNFKRLTLGLFKKVFPLAMDCDNKITKAKNLVIERALRNNLEKITALVEIQRMEQVELRVLTPEGFDAFVAKYKAKREVIEKRFQEAEIANILAEPTSGELTAWNEASIAWKVLASEFLTEYPSLEEITDEEYQEISKSFFARMGTQTPKSVN